MNGMFGSIYNNPMQMNGMNGMMFGINNCGINPYSSQALGYNLATTGLGLVGMILNGSFGSSESIHSNYDGRGTSKSTSNPASSNSVTEIKSDINNQVLVLNEDGGSLTFEKAINGDYKSVKIADKYQAEIDGAEAKINDTKTEIASKKTDIEVAEANLGSKPEAKDFKSEDGTIDKAKYEEAKKAWEKENKKIDEMKAELKNLEESIEETGKLGKALKEAKEAKDARQKAITDARLELDKLVDKYNKATTEGLQGTLNSGDGNSVSRLFSPNKRSVGSFKNAHVSFTTAIKSGNAADAKAAAVSLKVAYADVKDRNSSKDKTQAAIQLAIEYYTKNQTLIDGIADGTIDASKLDDKQKAQLGIMD